MYRVKGVRERMTGPPHMYEQGEHNQNLQQIAVEVTCGLVKWSS